MLKINLSKSAGKFLAKLQAKQARQLGTKIQDLRKDPSPPQDSSQLKGYPYRRADMGEYRIIYSVSEDTLQILIVGKRNDDEVYKKLRRTK